MQRRTPAPDDAHHSCCNDRSERCAPNSLPRRDFVKLAGAAAVALTTPSMPVMAGPFANVNEYLRLIPIDKRLDASWVDSLTARGAKETYSDKAALRHVGMPVGGFFAGTVYLCGDGRLWLWEIFNRDQNGIKPRTIMYHGEKISTGRGANFIDPAEPTSPVNQGFSIRIGEHSWSLDADGFAKLTFDGRYPVGRVSYRDPACPLQVELEAYSPFIPLNLDDSSIPAVILSYQITNGTENRVECEIAGHLENPICIDSAATLAGRRRNTTVADPLFTAVTCAAEPDSDDTTTARPDMVFDDFERATYDSWKATGTAFGDGPVEIAKIPDYQGDVGGRGKRVVNSHASAPGEDVGQKDGGTGTLTSRSFKITRRFINMLVGGGSHKGQTCVNLLVDGKIVASLTGRANNHMQPASFNVAKYEGHQAQLQIVDNYRQSWGNIGVDQIVFSDRPPRKKAMNEQPDFGTMTLTLLGRSTEEFARPAPSSSCEETTATADLGKSLTGHVGRRITLGPGESTTVHFAFTWHFPNLYGRGVGRQRVGNLYAERFESATAVARYLAANWSRLTETTRLWVDTWYDSSLPFWLLDRTIANTSTLATTTCYRFGDGRFWAWEGIGCCAGTCTHVWHYAQAPGRLFPELERLERERVNFGIGQHTDGGIGMRTGLDKSNEPAVDGQCGRILGVLREHQMSADDAFLRRLWPRVKKALEYMMRIDGNADGILEGSQPNTLDAAWYGKISFTSSLYLAAVRAGQVMAEKIGDRKFADRCAAIGQRGAQQILETYNGEYFTQIEDPRHKDAIGVGTGCYIDQIFGQTWSHWVGMGTLFDRDKQLSALRALWNYSFVPDVGPFRDHFKPGRWYAAAGDAGLLMCTWPKGGLDPKKQKHWQYMYFNECMTGFEWQAAAHMVWEGIDQPDILEHGLAVSRAIHDRYNAKLRNPYNEVECSDHYSRAMASYGVFQAVCGFQCDCPTGYLAFAPRLSPSDFRAPFVAAEGWGTYAQQTDGSSFSAQLTVRHGRVRVAALGLDVPPNARGNLTVTIGDRSVPARIEDAPAGLLAAHGCVLRLTEPIELAAGTALALRMA